MATLKTFELQGNKQSFANWISNLSPCDVPFTSMIGKEVIDQSQYSWQTDSLAPATSEAFEEGSQAVAQPRATTKVLTNFTSIVRGVASISDTVKNLDLYGRKKEVNYQLGKVGKEMLRDLEYMMLHQVNGQVGNPTQASICAGFEGLVAGMNVADDDTGAVVHKVVSVAKHHFDKDELFDLTANLFLAGSKADKIMFHPQYAAAFSELISNDVDSPHTHRMFDSLNSVYNAKVSKIKDPLGRIYTLIPNRNMPVDKIYFFNEKDWTQTILRAPATTKLGKKGSHDQYLAEMEVGLRHRHPYASGILALVPVDVKNDFFPARRAFTAGVKDSATIRADILINNAHEPDQTVRFHSSDPEILYFSASDVKTDVQGRAENIMLGGNKTGIVKVWTTCKGIKSQEHVITCSAPVILLISDNDDPVEGETVSLTATVQKADGSQTTSGLVLEWYVHPVQSLRLDSHISSTVASGESTITAEVLSNESTLIQVSLGRFVSDQLFLNYQPTPAKIEPPVLTENTLAIGDLTNVAVDVFDEVGDPIEGARVEWSFTGPTVAEVEPLVSVTDINGTATGVVTGIARGTGYISARIGNLLSDATQIFVGQGASMDFAIDPNPGTIGSPVKFTVTVTGQDGSPIRDTPVAFTTRPGISPPLPGGFTDIHGVYETQVSPLSNGEFTVTAVCSGYGISQARAFAVGDYSQQRPYVHVVSGHGGLHTHSTGIAKEVNVRSTLMTEPARGIRMVCESLNPEIATVSDLGVPSDFNGDYKILIHGVAPGTARIRTKARDNMTGWVEFSVQIGSPYIDVVVTPTTQTAGKIVEFSAALKDANDAWVPGALIEWEYPPLMLAHATTLPTIETDQYGRVYFERQAGVWGTHKLRAKLVANPAIASRYHNLTVVM